MNCCDYYGNCTQGRDCPVRTYGAGCYAQPKNLHTKNSDGSDASLPVVMFPNKLDELVGRFSFWWACALVGAAFGVSLGVARLFVNLS